MKPQFFSKLTPPKDREGREGWNQIVKLLEMAVNKTVSPDKEQIEFVEMCLLRIVQDDSKVGKDCSKAVQDLALFINSCKGTGIKQC